VPTGRRRHEPAELTLTVRRLDDGRLRFGTPTCPGWAFTAHRPSQIGEAIARAYTEAAVAAYARLHGVLYDVAAATDPGELPEGALAAATPRGRRHPAEPAPPAEDEVARRRRTKHPRTHPPGDWQRLDDGAWRSPTGRRYAPDSRQVQAVVASLGSTLGQGTPGMPGSTLGAWQTPLG
jgi:hypothetical protein